ncbi:M56 family metallopeptidase [Marinifilum sp. RC60d5]|uniref:M56 family metallopeptidase n=1 Tax=Marinifilum sp. RC60d5 TaxID=3458414 RepID=UPI004036153B
MNNIELQQLVIATGWTLLHSVWQIAIYGLIIYLIFRFVSKDNAKTRYAISALGLLCIFLSSLITFIHYTYKTVPISDTGTVISSDLLLRLLNSTNNSDVWSLKNIKIDNYIPLLVNVWIIGVCALSLQMTVSYLKTLKMKKYLAYPVCTKTRVIAEQLIRKFKLKNKIIFKESGYVQVPSLIGYFKPVVLLPVSMLSGIPHNQLEIIIAHELAHIKRHDYLFQFIQGILELLFFYHPVVWWLSSVVNTEREHLCDDLAVKICGESLTLIKALNNMEAIRKKRFELVLGLSGKKDNILNRVQRILRPKTKQSTQLEKYLLSGLFVFLFTGLIFISNFAVSGNLFPGKQFYSNINIIDMENSQANSPKSTLAILNNRKIKNEFNDTIVNQSEIKLDVDINTHEDRYHSDVETNKSKDSLDFNENVKIKVDEIINEQIKIIQKAQKESKENELELEKSLKTINSQEYREQLENQLKGNTDSDHISPNIFIKSDLSEKHPIIIVDGKKQAYSYLENVNPDNISSINVIKDKSAKLKYGDESKHGVIEIITKSSSSINEKSANNEIIVVGYGNIKDSIDFSQKKIRKSTTKMPLCVINGEKQSYVYLKSIDPNTISEITVLKDKSAIDIYGKEAANGVIIVTLKPDNETEISKSTTKIVVGMPGSNKKSNSDILKWSHKSISDSTHQIFIVNDKDLANKTLDTSNENNIDRFFMYKGKYTQKINDEDEDIFIESKDDDSREFSTKIWHNKTENPLLILDGKKTDLKSMDNMDPELIKSINILKDKSATAIYGKEGENGVILIRSKNEKTDIIKIKGKAGKNAPIYILNGKNISEKKLKKIDKDDIESVNVYKGKMAIEKYGKKAKNGVIVITMKK